jgi:hypothetical protein
MKKLSIALAALAAAAFTLPAFAQVDSSSPKDDKATHKDAVQKKESNAGSGQTSDTKTSKKAKKAKKPMKSGTNAGSGSTSTSTSTGTSATAGQEKSGAADNKATSGTSSPTKP